MRTHKETLNRHKLYLLKQGADEVARTGKNIVDIKIFRSNINSYNNWQKLRYHGLIAKTDKRGEWVITTNGWNFLRGDISLPSYVVIGDNHIVERADTHVDANKLYKTEEIVDTTFEYYEPTYNPKPQTLQFAWGE
jgi:hypothetical protein